MSKVINIQRYLLITEWRKVKHDYSMTFGVQKMNVWKSLVISRLYTMRNSQKVKEFFSVRPIDECPKCLEFGHHPQTYKTNHNCRICYQWDLCFKYKYSAFKSVDKLCTHSTWRCIHCSYNHKASDSTCPIIPIVNYRFQKYVYLAVTPTIINEYNTLLH